MSTNDTTVNVSKLSTEFTIQIMEDLKKENDLLKSKVKHLEGLLLKKQDSLILNEGVKSYVEPELAIIWQQISLLEEQSMIRSLTTDEVKRFKILVDARVLLEKNNQPKDVLDISTKSEEELLKLVSEGD